MNYGEKIAELRKSAKMTQSELGEELNVTYQAVSKWERGESCPDFGTLSKIAKLFGVPISYFEEDFDGEASAAAAAGASVTEPEPAAQGKMLGVCTKCGRVVYEGEAFCTSPQIVCNDCHEREEKEREEAPKRLAAQQKAKKQAEKKLTRRKMIIGLSVAGAVSVALAVMFAVMFGTGALEYSAPALVGAIVAVVLAFTFISQMIWCGLIMDICLFGFVKVNFPGIIFTLDIDGIIFFILVKLLFGFLSIFLWIAFGLLTTIIAVLASPFVFIPKVIMMSCGKDGD